jgi:DNA-binding CsgD family transcriptional regulator
MKKDSMPLLDSHLLAKIESLQKEYQEYNYERFHPETPLEPPPLLPIDQLLLDSFSSNDDSVKIIFDQTNFKALAISDNVEAMLGYSIFDFNKYNTVLLYSALDPKHLDFFSEIVKWAISNEIYENKNIEKKFRLTLCGLKVHLSNGKTERLLMRYSPHFSMGSDNPEIAIITLNNISFMTKSDFCWGHIAYGKDYIFRNYMLSTDNKNHDTDIISDREKDVLRLITQGLESKEIAANLFISTNTVEKHRKNMLARTGLRDTTALVQISKMCGII